MPYNTLQYIAKEYNSMPYNAMAGARRRPASPRKSSLYHRCVRWMVMIKTLIIILMTKITKSVQCAIGKIREKTDQGRAILVIDPICALQVYMQIEPFKPINSI